MDNNQNKSSKPVKKFKDLLNKLELNPLNSNEEDVIKNTSSNGELSMIRFLLRQRNQFRR